MAYKGAWWVDSPAAVAALEAHGFNVHLIPYLSAAQFDTTLAAVPSSSYAIGLLTGTPEEKAAQVTRLKGSRVLGYVVWDEPNVGGTLLDVATQIAYYQAVKRIDPFKLVFASYHLEPSGVINPSYVVTAPGQAWDYAMLNYYPATWGITDAQAAANLKAALARTVGFFAEGTRLLAIQQAAGLTVHTPGWTRPIGGMLQAQQAIWAASGLKNVDALIYYGWGTNPEDVNLQTPALLAEAGNVRAALTRQMERAK